MYTQGKSVTADFQEFFFAENRLQVSDENGFLSGSILSGFKNKQTYSTESTVNVTFATCPENSNITILSEDSGIIIGRVDNERWLFSSSDKKNPCNIVASKDYSTLNGYIDADHCADMDTLRANFLQLLRIATECSLAYHNSVSVHASCIAYKDQAILFIAPSGTGKSTQAEIWKSHLGARIINGDRPLLRLYPEETHAYGVPWDGKEQIFVQESYPIKAIVEVRRASANSIRSLSINQAFKIMMKQSFIPMWDDAAKFFVIKTIRMISQTVPFYRLFCLPETNSADILNNVIFMNNNNLVKKEQKDMKIKEGFILKNLMDEWIVMPTGTNIKQFEGAIVLNDIAAFIWKQLEKPMSKDDLLQSILNEYDISKQTADEDMNSFLDRLKTLEILQEE